MYRLSATIHRRAELRSLKQDVRSKTVCRRTHNVGVAVLPENLVSGFLGECLQSGGIRVGQHCIFVGSAFRALPCCNVKDTQSPEVAWCYARLRSLAEVLLISGSRTGSFGNVITYAVRVYISLSVTLIGLPVLTGFGSGGGKAGTR